MQVCRTCGTNPIVQSAIYFDKSCAFRSCVLQNYMLLQLHVGRPLQEVQSNRSLSTTVLFRTLQNVQYTTLAVIWCRIFGPQQ